MVLLIHSKAIIIYNPSSTTEMAYNHTLYLILAMPIDFTSTQSGHTSSMYLQTLKHM